jgi:hypothetical protein
MAVNDVIRALAVDRLGASENAVDRLLEG